MGTGMFNLENLWHTAGSHPWLWIPFSCAVLISLVLWSGRIRQPSAINLLAIGLVLPAINLSLVATSAVMMSNQLSQDWVALLPF
ncbi:MAG: hypothetical protein CL546_13580 [Alcanivorax sp.]|jgi:hypothetical protein|nr:hypothetical protein [Alcanivorax sp.]|tara:strand:+ start:194 stop:448 length:255 start_codon:yes stop_codon:yes gene_type:complete